jgi:hypothetical protein
MYFLGTISGMSGAYNNLMTGVSGVGSFTIPRATRQLYLVPGASGINFEFGVATTFQTTAVRSARLKFISGEEINGPFECHGGPDGSAIVVSCYQAVAGWSVKVYGGR